MRRVMTRIMPRSLFVAAAGLSMALGFAALPARGQDVPAGNAENGKRIYLADGCFMCHGRVGQGGGYNGPVPALAKTELPFEPFKLQLRQPADDMPAYSEKVLTDQQVADIYAFVQSLPGRRNPKDIPLLNN
jgi:mono/diheme cytochrome c family protein